MRKALKIIATLLLSVMCLSAFACGGGNGGEGATLNPWNAPTYASVQAGNIVVVQQVVATDSKGNTHLATAVVKDPSGQDVAVANGIFTPSVAGTYTIIYSIELNGKTFMKPATVTVTAGGGGGGGQGGGGEQGGGQSGSNLSGLAVTAGSEEYFTVSGSNVTITKAVSVTDYKSVEFAIPSGWTLANGERVSITVKNNGTSLVDVKYTVVFSDNTEDYGYPDLQVNAGATDYYNDYVYHSAENRTKTPSLIKLMLGSSKAGSITITATLKGTSGDASVLGQMVAWGEESDLTVEGTTVTLKRALAENEYKGVAFTGITGWTKANGGSIKIQVANNTSASVTIKYKVTTNTGVGYGYPDLVVAASATGSETYDTLTYDQTNATSISQIEIFIITTASSGTLNFTVSVF